MLAKLKAKTVLVSKINESTLCEMFQLFSQYYANVDFEAFKSDLSNKDHVIILFDKKKNHLKGFSTITSLNTTIMNKPVRGMFSGDTVIDKEYWGQGVLGVAFLIHLFKEKLKRPFTPLYWFLISKGHKTYLLMANNFTKHYPRYEAKTPLKEKNIINAFANELYSNHFCEKTGVISFGEKTKDCLKSHVASITSDMLSNKRIAYFCNKNPGWKKGDELACIAEMTFLLPVQYFFKSVKKLIMKKYLREKQFIEMKN